MKWEYQVIVRGFRPAPDYIDSWLNEIGAMGWELVQVESVKEYSGHSQAYLYYFKKQKENQ